MSKLPAEKVASGGEEVLVVEPIGGGFSSNENNNSTDNIPYNMTQNPCHLVRHSCMGYVLQQQEKEGGKRHVTINHDAIPKLAQRILEQENRQQPNDVSDIMHTASTTATTTTTTTNMVEWDEEDWHYKCVETETSRVCVNDSNGNTTHPSIIDTSLWPSTIHIERVALYILALDAINFCFWEPQQQSTFTTAGSGGTGASSSSSNGTDRSIESHYKYEYEDLARTLTNMAGGDHQHQHALIMKNKNQHHHHHHPNDNGNTTTTPTSQQQLLSSEYIFTPTNLQNMTVEQMTKLFQKHHPKSNNNDDDDSGILQGVVPPHMNIRCQIWNEIGTVLNAKPFHGSILTLLKMAKQVQPQQQQSSSSSWSTASLLVRLLINYFPNFRDDTQQIYNDHIYKSQQQEQHSSSLTLPPPPLLYFYKRAQICVGDLYAALSSLQKRLPNDTAVVVSEDDDHSLNTYTGSNMDEITTFADYRVPQLLRHCNILQYSTSLSHMIDNYMELQQHSAEEYAIRTCTIVAVELLVKELRHHQQQQQRSSMTTTTITSSWNAIQTDWYLWQLGEKMELANELLPHHRVQTTYY